MSPSDGGKGKRADRHLREIVRGSLVAFGVRAGSGMLEFLLNLVIARSLGAEGAGVFYVALTVTTIGSVVARLGLDNSLLRLCAAHAETQEWDLVRSASGRGLALCGAVSIVLSAAVYWTIDVLPGAVGGAEANAVKWMALAIAPLSWMYLYGELLKAVRHVFASQLVAAAALPALGLCLAVLLVNRYGVSGVVLGYVAAAFAAAALGGYCWRRVVPMAATADRTTAWRALLSGSLALLWIKSMRMAVGWLATAALVTWSSAAEVGVFNVALRISLALGLLLISVNSIAAPKFAALLHLGDRAQLEKTARDATRLLVIAAGPIVALFLLAPEWVMGWFGEGFAREGGHVLFVLTLGQAVNLATGPVNYLLMMSGHEAALGRCVTYSVVAGASALAALTPWLGALGAAIATSLAMAVLNLMAARQVRCLLGIVTIPFLSLRTAHEHNQ